MDSTEREAIIAAVTARVRSFEAAERARGAEQLIAHYATVPEFHFYHDGRRATYDIMAGGVRKALPAVRSLDVTYADVEVSPLGPEYALVSASFAARSGWTAGQPSSSRGVCRGCGGRSMANGSSLTAMSRIRWNLQSRRAKPSNNGLELTRSAMARWRGPRC